jgi:homoserine dehydrogenase
VLGDVVDASLNLRRASHASVGQLAPAQLHPMSELRCLYHLSLEADDRTGVLRGIAEVFERYGVSIRSMEQDDLGPSGARLVFVTHTAAESSMQEILADLRKLPAVRRVGSLLRVVDGAPVSSGTQRQ